MPLLATAATSPAHRVPCLEKERKKDRPVCSTPPTFGCLAHPMTRHWTADRYIYFYIQSRHGHTMSMIACERMSSSLCCGWAVGRDKTNWRRQVLGFDFFKQIWIPCCQKSKHTTNERRPPQIICGVRALVTLKCRQRSSRAGMGRDWMGWENRGGDGRGYQTQGNCELDFLFSQRVLCWAQAFAVRPRSRRRTVKIQGAITKGLIIAFQSGVFPKPACLETRT